MVYVQQIERCQPLYRASANLVLPSLSFPFLLSSLFLLPPFLAPSHPLRQGKCRLSTVGHPCEIGLRRRTYHILAGSVLGVWTHLEGVFVRHSGHNSRMQIARVRMPNKRLVGTSAVLVVVPFPGLSCGLGMGPQRVHVWYRLLTKSKLLVTAIFGFLMYYDSLKIN